MSNYQIQIIIQQLRHQLGYSNSGTEREEIKQQLEFWLEQRYQYHL